MSTSAVSVGATPVTTTESTGDEKKNTIHLEFVPLLQADGKAPKGVGPDTLLDRVHEIEAACFPADEAASKSSIKFRMENAPSFFMVASTSSNDVQGKNIIAFVCGTLVKVNELKEESMSTHEPQGKYLCIHSVAVEKQYRRQGIASRLLQAYISHVREAAKQVKMMLLISKEPVVPLYEGVGFTMRRKWPHTHGQDSWFECELALDE
jgi:ribosomal protein S18 acetylase RimI-like enzyme